MPDIACPASLVVARRAFVQKVAGSRQVGAGKKSRRKRRKWRTWRKRRMWRKRRKWKEEEEEEKEELLFPNHSKNTEKWCTEIRIPVSSVV